MAFLTRDFDIVRKRIREQEKAKIECENYILPRDFMIRLMEHYEKGTPWFKKSMKELERKMDNQTKVEAPVIVNTFLR